MAAGAGGYVRRDIWTLQTDDPIVTWYGHAVREMRERPADNVTSWEYQAAIHGTHAQLNQPEWNECQHGSWFFFPWHRMYLYFFELIAREAIVGAGGPANWALPYWNYGLGGRNAKLPLAFREPTLPDGSENPLYVAERGPGVNTGASMPAAKASPANALARPQFVGTAEFGGGSTGPEQFAALRGATENVPHGSVHDWVGKGGGPMSDILRAAQDPIFWLHHANIDRLWSEWLSMPGHANPTDPEWLRRSFGFFDPGGAPASKRCENVLATLPDLGYTYDTAPPPPPAVAPAPPPAPAAPAVAAPAAEMRPPERQMVGASQEPVQLVGQPASVEVAIDAQAGHPLAANERVYLNVEDIEGEANPGTAYGVYANLPQGAPPDAAPAYHVGTLSFFGIELAREPAGDEPAHNLQSSYELTRLARELQAHDAWAGHMLTITFRPLTSIPAEVEDENDPVLGPEHEERPVRIGRVSVFYDA